ncbi:MAG TPA: 3'-5' exonuclease [Candidatus Thermoplasmatota archaeon]|nr:3'-5' exonuclease [Candidatus Thermoplasmatota archaeon]
MERIVAFDLETTGLDFDKDRIVEFCFVTLDKDLNVLDRWVERVNPGIPIPEGASLIHGITDAHVAEKPGFREFAPKVQALITGAVLMAYNHDFDRRFLHRELTAHGQPGIAADHPFIDPYRIFLKFHPHTLQGAVRHYLARDHEGAHGAEADVLATVEVLRAQRKVHYVDGVPIAELVFRPERKWVDRDQKIYEGADGVWRFSFGKHQDKPLAEHLDYVKWMIGKDFSVDTKARLKELLDRVAAKAAVTP